MPFPNSNRKQLRIDGTANESVWFPVESQHVVDDDTENAFWQFRVSIVPTRENALKALDALETLELFKNARHPGLKIFIPSLTNDLSTWDSTIEGGDRDQRGKEICVYMECIKHGVRPDYYEGDYPSLSYLKQLMLDIWRVLQEAEVELAYIAPSVTEKAIKVTDGSMTPFMYSSFKPYKQRHGILHERGYNPTNKTDPLQGLEIHDGDLVQNGINAITPEQVQARMLLQREHYYTQLTRKLDELSENVGFESDENYAHLLQKLYSILWNESATPEEIEDFKNFLFEICDNFCPFPAEVTTNSDYFGRCRAVLGDVQATLEQKQEALSLLQQNIAHEKAYSIQEMSELLIADGQEVNTEVLSDQFDLNPARFQKIYQSLVLLRQEKEAIQGDVDYLNPGFFRKHWKAITASAITGLAVGVGLGSAMGGIALIPTGGLSILATPWAIGILGLAGLLIGGVSGLLGSVAVDLYQSYKKGKSEEILNLDLVANNGSYHQFASQLGINNASEISHSDALSSTSIPPQGKTAPFFEPAPAPAPAQLASSIKVVGDDLESDNDSDHTL